MGTDKGELGGFADFGEMGVLRKKAIAGMNGLGVGDLSGGDDAGHIHVAVCAAWGADAHRLVGKTDVERIAVGLRVNRHRTDAQFLAGADNADSNFPAIGNQDLLKHTEFVSVSSAAPKTVAITLP